MPASKEPIPGFVIDGWKRVWSSRRLNVGTSPLSAAMLLACMLVLVPVALVIVLVAALLAVLLILARLIATKLGGLLPRRDGRENVRVIARR